MKFFLQTISFMGCIFYAVSSQACWDAKERSNIEGFAELDELLILSIKDAINCKPLSGVKVVLGGLKYTTDSRGYIELPMQPLSSQMEASVPLILTKSGYITINTDLLVEAGTVLNRRLVLSPALPPGKVRFVLQWADTPTDLDLHLKSPDFHISYRNKRNVVGRAKLDVDELEGYGPETITLDKIDSRKTYELWVHNFSNDENYKGIELVYVYSGNKLVKELRLPSSNKRSIKVLKISNGVIKILNQPVDQKP